MEIIHGDCLDVMRGMAAGSVDAVVTDPPYGIDYQSAWRTDNLSHTGGSVIIASTELSSISFITSKQSPQITRLSKFCCMGINC